MPEPAVLSTLLTATRVVVSTSADTLILELPPRSTPYIITSLAALDLQDPTTLIEVFWLSGVQRVFLGLLGQYTANPMQYEAGALVLPAGSRFELVALSATAGETVVATAVAL